MAKDPAMLWYWNDWQGGTATLSRHLKGCYIDILHAQFNSGPLSLEEIKTVLGADFVAWHTLSKKFQQTPAGLFFNERLEAEKIKRQNFCESRRNNKEGKTLDATSEKHMINHMENENRNANKIEKEKGVVGEKTISVEMKFLWLTKKPQYPVEDEKDLPALKNISDFIKTQMRKEKNKGDPHFGNKVTDEEILQLWDVLAEVILSDNFWKNKPLNSIQNHTQEFWNKAISNANNTGKKFDKDGNEILTGRITKNAAAELLAAARLHHARKENAYGNTG